MKARLLVSAVGIPFLLIMLLVLPAWGTMLLCMALAAIAALEISRAAGGSGRKRFSVYGAVFSAAVPAIIYFIGVTRLLAVIFGVMLLLAFLDLVFTRGQENASSFADVCMLLVSVSFAAMFSCLMRLRMDGEYGRIFVLAPLVAAFSSDSGAFFTGRALGKHKLAPLVSPNKTVEGAFGGLAGGLVGMLLFGALTHFIAGFAPDYPAFAVYGIIGSVFGQLGDLSFSAVKREYDIKDYGRLLPGHGGVLDRFDSVLFVSPAFLLLTEVLPL